jgi:hypothetical protein
VFARDGAAGNGGREGTDLVEVFGRSVSALEAIHQTCDRHISEALIASYMPRTCKLKSRLTIVRHSYSVLGGRRTVAEVVHNNDIYALRCK